MLPAGCQVSTSMLNQKQAPGHLCCMAGQTLGEPPGGQSGLPQASAGSSPGVCPGWPCRGPGSLSLWSQTTPSLLSQVSLSFGKQKEERRKMETAWQLCVPRHLQALTMLALTHTPAVLESYSESSSQGEIHNERGKGENLATSELNTRSYQRSPNCAVRFLP